MTQSHLHAKATPSSRRAWPLLMLLAAAGTGCYRATGYIRPTLMSSEIPAEGGDRLSGLKATAGPGDFYLGNDFVHLAVDGALYGDRPAQFDAPSGGGILDVGAVALDQSFRRVPVPSDLLERLGQVVNQDPDLPLVFDRISPLTGGDVASLEMEGGILDPLHKLGLPTDGKGRVTGLSVTHRISLGQRDRSFNLTTSVTNQTGGAVPIHSLGDALIQKGGGYRFVVPGQAPSGIGPAPGSFQPWGVEIPGSDFTKPLETAVKAPGVGFQGVEPAGEFVDSHLSMGLMSTDTEQVLVTSDPQHHLAEPRPVVPTRLVVGSLPAVQAGVPVPLAAGATLTHHRRLYLVGGTSLSTGTPNQTTDIFNQMAADRYTLFNLAKGLLSYGTFGTAAVGGSLQTEIRFERYLGPSGTNAWDPVADKADHTRGLLERVEWLERGEVSGTAGLGSYGLPNLTVLPAPDDPARTGHHQVYKVTLRNRNEGQNTPFLKFTDTNSEKQTQLSQFLEIRPDKLFQAVETLAPERLNFPYATDNSGNIINRRDMDHYFLSRDDSANSTTLQPMRVTLAGTTGLGGALDPAKDPNVQRFRHWSSIFSPAGINRYPGDQQVGAIQFRAGNQVFGSAFLGTAQGVFPGTGFPLTLHQTYRAFATRGPLAPLFTSDLDIGYAGSQTTTIFNFTRTTAPAGWVSFDLPGTSLATTGGMHPFEQLTSALAEDVQVVGRTEMDRNVSGDHAYNGFRYEFDPLMGVAAEEVGPLGVDPLVVGARSSALPQGTVTALFVPEPTLGRLGGARPSKGWTVADFLSQAEGKFTVVHRPLGPGGLFQTQGFSLTDALGSGANAWWTQTSALSGGKRMGDFDALELIRAESLTSRTQAQWHQEYKDLRAIWFKLISAQSPTAFTKALGLSAGVYSVDTPVGTARTFLKVGGTAVAQSDLSPVLSALQSGAAVASTGPFLDVTATGTAGTAGPGQLLTGANASVTLTIALVAPAWVPVEQVRVWVNGALVQTLDPSTFTTDATDARKRSLSLSLPLPQDAWIVVEAGVPEAGPTLADARYTAWFKVQHNTYPLAVTNPIFVDQNGGGYTPPGN